MFTPSLCLHVNAVAGTSPDLGISFKNCIFRHILHKNSVMLLSLCYERQSVVILGWQL